MRPKISKKRTFNNKIIRRKTSKRKRSKRTIKGGFSELSYFLQKGVSTFETNPPPAFGNTGLVPPFPYFQS